MKQAHARGFSGVRFYWGARALRNFVLGSCAGVRSRAVERGVRRKQGEKVDEVVLRF